MSSILFEDITILDENGKAEPHGLLGVSGATIDCMGSLDALDAEEADLLRARYDEVYDGSGKLVMPGLYNTHAHVPMTLLRGRGENLALDAWLNDSIFPFEAHITDDDAYWATLLGIAEMARFGTVSFSDMYYNSDARAAAILESGIKCNLGHSVLCFDPEASYESLDSAKVNDHLLARYHGAGEGRLLLDANLHAEYTSTPKVARGLAEWAKANELIMQVHVSETASEVAACKERHGGLTPVAYLAECGLFDVPAIAAHCVHLEGDDLAILAEKGVAVATNPASNAKLGSGVADTQAMVERGILLTLGTDGVASNNNHNIWKDLYLLALMNRVSAGSPVGIPASELVRIATRNGALAQGREDCGTIAVGAKADLAVFAIDTPWMEPVGDLVGNLVYSAQGSDVVLTMVDGTVIYRDGSYPTIDVERAIHEVGASRARILAALGE